MTTEEKTRNDYEIFKELYNQKDHKDEGIYLSLSENPEIMKYLTQEEKAGVAKTILNLSNEKIKNLETEVKKLNKELNESGQKSLRGF